MTLAEVISIVRADGGNDDQWLYIAGDETVICLTTDAELGSFEIDEDSDEEILPESFKERNLYSTIDYWTLCDCVKWADRLSGRQNDAAAAEIIRYYIRFDAVPERLGAPDPPPFEETQRKLDRQYYDSLGPENVGGSICKMDGCNRVVVKFAAYCRPHQFEKMQKRPCPFQD